MQEIRQTNQNDKDPDVLRFEEMENSDREQYFDVESIENMVEFYAESGQIGKAEQVLKLGLKLHPDSISLLIIKTYILIEKGEEDIAIPLLENLLKFEETDIELYYNLGWAHLKTGNPEKALSYFKNALSIAFDEHEELILEIAFTLNEFDMSAQAIELLEESILKYPNNEILHLELAYTYDKENNFEKTLSTYNRLLEINSFSEFAWYNLAAFYSRNCDHKNALACFNLVLAINPDNGEALFDKAGIFLEMKEYRKAFDCYIDCVSYKYEILLCYHQIAYCLEQMKLNDLALRIYEMTINVAPAFLLPWLGYISLLINCKDVKKALEKSTEAILISDMLPEFMYLRAKALLLAKNYPKALSWLERSIKNEPDNIRNIYEWLKVKKELRPKKDYFAILKELKPRTANRYTLNYVSAGVAILDLRDFSLAGKYLENALIESSGDFDYFLDTFSLSEDELFKNETLNKILVKYFDYE